MLITDASFCGSGSSAITNIFCECDNVVNPGFEYEVRFIHDPDGLSDLEYNLIDNPNRHNTGHAIKRFKQMVDWKASPIVNGHYNKAYLYEAIFNGRFKELSYRYIEDICDLIYTASWTGDAWLRGRTFTILNRLATGLLALVHSKPKGLMHEQKRRFGLPLSLIPRNELTYAGTFEETRFLESTQRYLSDLLVAANPDNHDYLLVDQMLPPTNLSRYLRYFAPNTVKIFVVDRDPRDLYLIEKLVWFCNIYPTTTVEEFCSWFAWTRGQYEKFTLPDDAMYVQFEDIIYHYDKTVQAIFDFVGMDPSHHSQPKTVMNPEKSIMNTRLWERYPGYENDIHEIEERFGKYLYHYE